VRQGGLDQEEGAADVDGEDEIPVIGRDIRDMTKAQHAGDIAQRVEPAQFVHRTRNEAAARRGIGDVEGDGVNRCALVACQCRRFFQACLGDVGERERRARIGQGERGGAPQAGCRAGDRHHLADERPIVHADAPSVSLLISSPFMSPASRHWCKMSKKSSVGPMKGIPRALLGSGWPSLLK
jgi:hypothetical protein